MGEDRDTLASKLGTKHKVIDLPSPHRQKSFEDDSRSDSNSDEDEDGIEILDYDQYNSMNQTEDEEQSEMEMEMNDNDNEQTNNKITEINEKYEHNEGNDQLLNKLQL